MWALIKMMLVLRVLRWWANCWTSQTLIIQVASYHLHPQTKLICHKPPKQLTLVEERNLARAQKLQDLAHLMVLVSSIVDKYWDRVRDSCPWLKHLFLTWVILAGTISSKTLRTFNVRLVTSTWKSHSYRGLFWLHFSQIYKQVLKGETDTVKSILCRRGSKR